MEGRLRPKRFLLCTALAIPCQAAAQTLTFEADGGVVLVRTYDQFGAAIIEFIGEAGAIYQCVILDAAGEPIATATAMADVGQIIVQGVDATDIAEAACRKVM